MEEYDGGFDPYDIDCEDEDEPEDCDYGLTEFCIGNKMFCEDCEEMIKSNEYWTPSKLWIFISDLRVSWMNLKLRFSRWREGKKY